MKILRIIPSVDPKGGGPMEGARRIDAELGRLGHTVEVVSLDAPDADYLVDYPAQIYAMGPPLLGYRYSSRLLPWLNENRERFDAVIVNGLWQYHGFAAWRALAGRDIPYFVFTHGMLDPWFKKSYPLKHIKKWMYWPWADYRLLRDARAVLFTSEEERRLAKKSFWLYKCTEVVTSYGAGTPPSDDDGSLAQRFIQKHPEIAGKRVVLFLSRIHEKKGCDLLLEAFGKFALSDASLHLVMAGPDQTGWMGVLKQRADELGISDRITWPGMLRGDEKWGAFRVAEVFCLPSHQENFGIVVAEALSCGTPVLISNQVNIWREVEQDGAAFVSDDTADGTEKILASWLSLSLEGRNAMAQCALASFDRRFRIERVADDLIRNIQYGLVTV